MAESEGHSWKIGLSIVVFGIVSVMTIGVLSATNPYKPPSPGELETLSSGEQNILLAFTSFPSEEVLESRIGVVSPES